MASTSEEPLEAARKPEADARHSQRSDIEPSLHPKIERAGHFLADAFHLLGLFVIGATVVWSAALTFSEIISNGNPSLDDLLLLFIYLELGAMVGIYFRTRRLPVRFLVYIAITAITRFLTVDIKDLTNESVLSLTAAIFLLTLAALMLQLASTRFREAERDC